VHLFEITPKAFANFSPGLLQPWVKQRVAIPTLKAFAIAAIANAFSVGKTVSRLTQG
jgi:hypothetical protein